MTWGPRAQRRADDFDTLVERASTGAANDPVDPRAAELLELVGALRSVPVPQPRAEFVADLRTRLMAEAETALVPTDVTRLQLPARRTTRERRIAAIVGGLAIAGATTSVAMAAQSALPGESLYPIKRVIESAHSGLSLGEARKGSTELANATSRLDEATALAQDPGLGDEERIARTLGTFTDQATTGADLLLSDYADTGRESSIVSLRDFAASSMDQLADLEPQIPYDARDELIAAASTIAQIDAEAAQQCPACGGDPVASIPPALLAAEQVDLPAVPSIPPAQSTGDKTRGDGARPGGKDKGAGGTQGDPGLPDVEGVVPPGSVLDPADPTESAAPNPIKDLTDGLTGVLTGKGATGGSGSGGSGTGGSTSSPSTAPLDQVVEGVGDILEGVLDPITGTLLPRSQSTP